MDVVEIRIGAFTCGGCFLSFRPCLGLSFFEGLRASSSELGLGVLSAVFLISCHVCCQTFQPYLTGEHSTRQIRQ